MYKAEQTHRQQTQKTNRQLPKGKRKRDKLQVWDYHIHTATYKIANKDLTGGPGVKNLPGNIGDTGLIPHPGRFHISWCNKAQAPTTTGPML